MLGKRLLTANEVTALADLPSREVILAQLTGAVQAPIAQLASLLAALPRNFAYGLKALVDQQGGVPAEPEPVAEAAPEPVAEVAAEAEPAPAEAAEEIATESEAPATPAAEDTATEETE